MVGACINLPPLEELKYIVIPLSLILNKQPLETFTEKFKGSTLLFYQNSF